MITKSTSTVRTVAIFCFLLMATSVFSQKESVIFVGNNGKLTNLAEAVYMQKIIAKSAKASVVQTFMLNGLNWEKVGSEVYKKQNDSTWQIKAKGENAPGTIIRTFIKQADGMFKFKDIEQDQTVRIGQAQSITPLLLHGSVTEYYLGGKKKSVSQYNHNELVSNENWNADGTKYIDNIFYSADTYPFFNQGNKVLNAHILKGFKDANIDIASIDGSMKIGFVVMENGTIGGVKIVKGLGPVINGVAVESFATLMGPWTPAKLNGQPVRYFQVFPINFKSNESHVEFAEMRGGILHFQTY